MSAVNLNRPNITSTGSLETKCKTLQFKKTVILQNLQDDVLSFVLKNIFGEHLIARTRNHGSSKDIPLYVHCKQNPIDIADFKILAKTKGFALKKDHMVLTPYGKGVCFGVSLFFAKEWSKILLDLPSSSPESAIKAMKTFAKEFKDGAPFEATLIQAYNDVLYDHSGVYYEKDIATIFEVIFKEYPSIKTDSEKTLCWQQLEIYFTTMTNYTCGTPLIQATRQFLESGKTVDQGFAAYVAHYFETTGTNLPPEIYSTLRNMEGEAEMKKGATYYMQVGLDMETILGSLVGLKFEKTPYMNATAGEVLDAMSHLDPALYMIAMPCYTVSGKQDGAHAIFFHKFSDELSFLFDSNFAIGYAEGARQKVLWKNVLYLYVGEATTTQPKGIKKIRKALKTIRNNLSMTIDAKFGDVKGFRIRRVY